MPVVNVYSTSVTSENVSRFELLAWVNDCLQSKLTKIEEMATGAAYCHLTDFLFPSKVPLKKVKWNSRSDVDWMNNWRVLQQSWKTIGIDKPVPVQNLMRAKFQDNFEFLQWFKKFFDANYDGHEYDPVAARNYEEFPAALPGGSKQRAPPLQPPSAASRRGAAVPPALNTTSKSVARPVSNAAGTLMAQNAQSRAKASKALKPPAAQPIVGSSLVSLRRASPRSVATPRPSSTTTRHHQPQQQLQQNGGGTASGSAGRASTGVFATKTSTTPEVNGLKQQIQVLEAQNSDVNAQLVQERERAQVLERERNFYFDKLRTIEILCGSCAMSDGGLGGTGILRVDQVQTILWDRSECASSTDGGSSAHTRLSPQPRGDLPRLESPDAEQMHAMAMMQHNSNKLNSSDAEQGNASGSLDTAHLEDTFLLGGAVGSDSSAFVENGSGTTVQPNQPILDDKSVAEGGTERVESRGD
uniref:Calponin-homology (CH) domain-containing protein n=1 Tax=Globodera pallida TaxID=36090 RepID=A0A183BKD5_GLOPA